MRNDGNFQSQISSSSSSVVKVKAKKMEAEKINMMEFADKGALVMQDVKGEVVSGCRELNRYSLKMSHGCSRAHLQYRPRRSAGDEMWTFRNFLKCYMHWYFFVMTGRSSSAKAFLPHFNS